jgi:hypothetical protein
MATTTNYSWTTPDDTALVKDGASAIRTLGSAVDTTTKALNPSTTLGDIEYRSSSANTNTRLGIGSSGQVLTVASGVPTWAAPSSSPTSGQSRVDTQQTTSSTSYVGLTTAQSVTITTGTKVLVIVSSFLLNDNEGQTSYASFAISGATTRAASDTWAASNYGGNSSAANEPIQVSYVSFQTVTAGSNTFTAQFRSSAAVTANFKNRQLIVIDLGS